MKIAVDIAKAIVAALNAGVEAEVFEETFLAERPYNPAKAFERLKHLKVIVAPRSTESEIDTRADDTVTIEIDIGVGKMVNPEDDEEVDALIALVDRIEAYMNRRPLDGIDAVWNGSRVDPIFDEEWMRERRCFASAVRLTYLAKRNAAATLPTP